MVGAVAFRLDPFNVQPADVSATAKLTAPVPDPPADVSATGVPAGPAVEALLTVSAAWVAAVNVNTAGEDDTAEWIPDAALVAVTVHDAGAVAFKLAPDSVQPVPVPDRAYVTAPAPDPPADVSATGVPAGPDADELLIDSAACGPVNVNVFATLVADA